VVARVIRHPDLGAPPSGSRFGERRDVNRSIGTCLPLPPLQADSDRHRVCSPSVYAVV
jgi:hypothetical protein